MGKGKGKMEEGGKGRRKKEGREGKRDGDIKKEQEKRGGGSGSNRSGRRVKKETREKISKGRW